MVTDNDYLAFLKTAKVVLFPLSTIAQCIVNNVLNNASCFVLLKKREGMLGQIYLFYLLEKLF